MSVAIDHVTGAGPVTAPGLLVPASFWAALAAMLVSLALHASLSPLGGHSAVEQAGGQTELAAQGSSFANLAEGILSAQSPSAPISPLAPQSLTPPPPVTPIEAQVEAQVEARVADAVVPQALEPVQAGIPFWPLEVQKPVSSQNPPPMEAVQRRSLAAAEPRQPLAAHLAQTPIEDPPVDPAPKPVSKPRGNSTLSATRGTTRSSRQASGGQAQRQAGQAQVQGNAAVSNYPGQVMRKIQRAKRRAAVKGVAVVRFSIGENGALTSLSIARSSGSAKLDAVALAQLRRAAPFPPPPAGARRSFTVRIKGN